MDTATLIVTIGAGPAFIVFVALHELWMMRRDSRNAILPADWTDDTTPKTDRPVRFWRASGM